MIIVRFRLILGKGVRKGKKLKTPRYASTAATRDYITTRDIIPNNYYNKVLNALVLGPTQQLF